MKRSFYALLSFGMIGVLVLLYSCQRELDPKLLTPPPVSSKDPAKLSASLKVWHGTRTPGTPPAPNSASPAVDPAANPSVLAVAGRYAIIKPEVISGDVAGYYLGIPGAGQYFKIDFSKPRNIAGRNIIRASHNGPFSRVQTGNADSSIVIVLPPNINVPDTFCVTYCPYDSLGNIGPPVTTCIYVTSLGAPNSEGWLKNEFKITSSWDLVGGVRQNIDTVIFNRWSAEGDGYYCDNTQAPPALSGGAISNGFIPIVSDSIKYTKANIRFAINGAFDYNYIEDDKSLDFLNSTCSSFAFLPVDNYSELITGAYNYNPATNKMILIFEFDQTGIPDPEYWEYDVIKVTDTHFILRDPIDNYYIRFER